MFSLGGVLYLEKKSHVQGQLTIDQSETAKYNVHVYMHGHVHAAFEMEKITNIYSDGEDPSSRLKR